MTLTKKYNPSEVELRLQRIWQEDRLYSFVGDDSCPVYAIDTPPATVSGHLHLGHVYSYSQTDFMARFWRMNGMDVFYPMGFDDNGLPTERLVERTERIVARELDREDFVHLCMQVSEHYGAEYKESSSQPFKLVPAKTG